METIGKRIKIARERAGLTQPQLAEKCHWSSQSRVSNYETDGREPKSADLKTISKATGVSFSWLSTGEGEPDIVLYKNGKAEAKLEVKSTTEQYHSNITDGPEIQGRVPLISMVQAGNFCESIDLFQPGEAEEWIACPASHSDQSYALRVQGESMLPRFSEGEIIIVDPNVAHDAGKFVIARRNSDHKTTFKQLMKDDDDFYLKALNPDWGDRYIRMAEEWHVCGVVICKIDLL